MLSHSFKISLNRWQDYVEAKQQLAFLSASDEALRAEIETIATALGGDEGGQHPHTFQSASFSIPTQCGYCKVR